MKKFVFLSVLAAAFGGLTVASTGVTAAAAETHSDCVTFDDQGNVTSVVPSCTMTVHADNVPTMTQSGFNPCTGDPGTEVITTKQDVFHVTVNKDGDVWVTSTSNGTASFVPADPSLPVYTGTWTSWFGGSLNKQNSVLHDTFTFRVRDGVNTIVSHTTDHMSFSASGTPNIFSQSALSCG